MSALDNAVAPDNLGEPADRLALEGTELSGDLSAFVDTRTHILERRRTMAKIRRRGWLIRRMLLVADVVGLVAAFVVSEAELGRSAGAITSSRILLFVATLPGWILTARLYGLYDHDEERTDHSTIDEVVAVFHVITIGTWILFVAGRGTGVLTAGAWSAVTFWVAAVALVSVARGTARWVSRRQLMYLQNLSLIHI